MMAETISLVMKFLRKNIKVRLLFGEYIFFLRQEIYSCQKGKLRV